MIYFTALDRVSRLLFGCIVLGTVFIVERYGIGGLIRFGDDLLSHVLRRSTIGATALNGWVRDGTRCFARAMITKPNKFLIKRSAQQSDGGRQGIRRMPVPAPSPLERKACFCQSHVQLIVCVCFCPVKQSCFYWIKSSLSSN